MVLRKANLLFFYYSFHVKQRTKNGIKISIGYTQDFKVAIMFGLLKHFWINTTSIIYPGGSVAKLRLTSAYNHLTLSRLSVLLTLRFFEFPDFLFRTQFS